MIVDNHLVFSDSQAVTASGASTNVIDTGGQTYATDFQGGSAPALVPGALIDPLKVVVDILAQSGTTPTFQVKLQGSNDNSTFTDISIVPPAAATPVAGTQLVIPFRPAVAYRYYRLYYVIAGTSPSITFTAALVFDAENRQGMQTY